MGLIQNIYASHLESYKTRFTQLMVEDVQNPHDQNIIIIDEHKRAHRNWKENKQQILQRYYFPGMAGKIKEVKKSCATCRLNKYDTNN